MAEHDLFGIIKVKDPSLLIVACVCGDIASGKTGAQWAVITKHDSDEIIVSPSIDWQGHFHTGNPVNTRYVEFSEVPCGSVSG